MGPVVSFSESETSIVLTLTGTVRTSEAALLHRELLQMQGKPILLDWADANHVDASVLQVLLSFRLSSARPETAIAVTKDSPAVRDYLETSGLSRYFPVAP